MAVYSYQALQTSGKSKRGVIDALTLEEAKEKLRGQGVLVTQIESHTIAQRRGEFSGQQLVDFTHQLARLVDAGLPLYDALAAIEEQSRDERYASILLGICDRIQAGSSLSEALRSYPKSFPPLYCAMVSAGESSGTLGSVLDKLSTWLDRQMQMRKQMINALIYPAVLFCFCMIVVFFLLTFAVPSIESLLGEHPSNAITSIVIGASHLLSHYWWALLLLAFTAFFGARYWFKSAKGKMALHRTALRLPIVKQLVIQSALARFMRTLATLQEGGITWIDSLRLSRQVLMQPLFEEIIERAEERIISGSSLGVELRKEKLIPPMAAKMVMIGEESGHITPMLYRVASMYEEELEKNLPRIVALAQPIILIAMGGLIGMVMLAILIPLTDMSTFF
jgi:general secretion pathway protein F